MSKDNATAAPEGREPTPAEAARTLVRQAIKGGLATLEPGTGHPYASLVLVATDPAGAPILLLSSLALHTRNLEADPRASVLLDGTSSLGDPLAGGRVTLIGRLAPSEDPSLRRRYLARHPSAAGYADFGDFKFFSMTVEKAHYVGGFGRIVTLPAADILEDTSDATGLLAAEADIIAHMTADHADAITLYATRLAGAGPGTWRLVGVDPSGLDLLLEDRAVRLPFPERVRTPGDIRRVLVAMAERARASGADSAT